jgi:cbb3-type cytochrome oxidase subunit 1
VIQAFSDWLAATRLSQTFADLGWFVPTVQTIHILAIAAVVTMLSMLNFRLLRITRDGPSLQNLAGGYVPWVWRFLVILLISGALLTITEPGRELMNNAFRLKMLLVVALVVLTVVLHSTLRKDPEYWTSTPQRRVLGGAIAVASLALCLTIVAAGRLIAYV